jgi:type 1 glutamine amidotransferase
MRIITSSVPGLCFFIAASLSPCLVSAAGSAAPKVLIYTRNHVATGKGYVHDNIAASVTALRELCAEKKIGCDNSDDPAVFTTARLAAYRAVIFSNSNNDAFSDPAQSKALTTYIENGGAFIGIHSASGSERQNPEFKRILGGTFKWHTPDQKFTVVVVDPKHPATLGVPARWERQDEGYLCDLVPGLHVLLEMDTSTVTNPPRAAWALKFEGNRFPLAWSHQVGKGRCIYTALGHHKEDYADPVFRKHLQGAILWALDMAN